MLAISQALAENNITFQSSGNYLSGWIAAKNGDPKNAAQFYAKVLKQDNNRPFLLEKTLMFKIQSGNIKTAENIAEKLIKIKENHSLARLVIALKNFKNGQYKKTRKYLNNPGQRPIDLLSSAMISAWAHAAEGEIRMAIIELSKLSKHKMFDYQKTYHGAIIADKFNRKDAAQKLYKNAYQKSKNNPRNVLAYGNFLERNGKEKIAENIYKKFLEKSANNYIIHAKLDNLNNSKVKRKQPFILNASHGAAEALFNIAELLYEQSSQEIALIYLNLALNLRPKFADAYMMIGTIRDKRGRYQDALNAYSQIPPNSPWKIEAEIRMAINDNILGNNDFAIKRLQILIDNLSGIIAYEPNLIVGTMLKDKEKFSQAVNRYSKAIKLLNNPERKHWNVFYFRGISYAQSNKWEKAEIDFLKALKLFPNQPQVLNYLGYSWIEMGKNFNKALEMINNALEQRPGDGYIVDSAGWAHYNLGNYNKAVDYLEKAISLKPGDMVINDHLGDAYWRVGRKIEAQFQWKRALSIAEDQDDINKIQTKINKGLPEIPHQSVSPNENAYPDEDVENPDKI